MISVPAMVRVARFATRFWLMGFALIATSLVAPVDRDSALYAQDVGIAVGEKAPGGPLETLDGKTVDLAQYYGKGPVVLEFWATWCPNCTQLEPAMRAAMTRHKDATFVTVAVSVNQSRERVAAWQAKNKLPGVLLYDRKGTVSGAFDVPATSYVVVVDKTGKVVYTGTGGTQNIDAALALAK